MLFNLLILKFVLIYFVFLFLELRDLKILLFEFFLGYYELFCINNVVIELDYYEIWDDIFCVYVVMVVIVMFLLW